MDLQTRMGHFLLQGTSNPGIELCISNVSIMVWIYLTTQPWKPYEQINYKKVISGSYTPSTPLILLEWPPIQHHHFHQFASYQAAYDHPSFPPKERE